MKANFRIGLNVKQTIQSIDVTYSITRVYLRLIEAIETISSFSHDINTGSDLRRVPKHAHDATVSDRGRCEKVVEDTYYSGSSLP